MSSEYKETIPMIHICNRCGYTLNTSFTASFCVEDVDDMPDLKDRIYCAERTNYDIRCPKCDYENNIYAYMVSINREMIEPAKRLIDKGFTIKYANSCGKRSKYIRDVLIAYEESEDDVPFTYTMAIAIDILDMFIYLPYKVNEHQLSSENYEYLKKEFEGYINFRKEDRNILKSYNQKVTDVDEYKEIKNILIDLLTDKLSDEATFFYIFDKPGKDTFVINEDSCVNEDGETIYSCMVILDNEKDPEMDKLIEWIDKLPDLKDINTLTDIYRKAIEYRDLSVEERKEVYQKLYSHYGN